MPNAAELRTALLTSADFPSGYVAQPVSAAGVGDSSLAGCTVLANNPKGVDVSATANLTDLSIGSSVSETLLQMAPGHSPAAMASFAAMPTKCRAFSGTLDNLKVMFFTAPLALTALGDQSTAARVTGTISTAGAKIYADVAVVRHHNTLIMITCVRVTVATTFIQQTVRKAYSAVAARW